MGCEWVILAIKSHLEIGDNGHLILRGVDLIELVSKYGTPLFVFDEATLVENFERFRQAFENLYPKVMVCYSIKTNNNLAICKILCEKGAYAEVSSELDLYVALKAGFPGERIIYDGPFKSEKALRTAVKEKVLLVNVESFTEMERLDRIAGELGVKQAIGLRVNPFRDPGFSKYFNLDKFVNAAYCNLESKFGFSLDEIYAAFERALKFENLSVEGIMTHPYREATTVLLPLIRKLHEDLGIEFKYLNVGGGFYSGDVRFIGGKELVSDFLRRKIGLKSKLAVEVAVPSIETVARSLVNETKRGLKGLPDPVMIVEPGRFIASSAGILLVRVDHVKTAGGYKWAFVNGGTNLLPRFGAVELRKVIVANRSSDDPCEEFNVSGPLLYSDDFITLKIPLPELCEGDVLAILCCGAYTLSRSNQFLYPRPAAVLVRSNGEVKVIRERETFEDVLCKDCDI